MGLRVETRENFYSLVNYYKLIGDKVGVDNITGQIIDPYGKMRGLIFSFNGDTITVLFPPSQPENLDIVNISADSYVLPDILTVVATFGDPVAITRDSQYNLINGVWFSIFDLQYGLYCPVIPTDA